MSESRIPCTTKRIIIFCVLRYNERKFKAEQVLDSFLCFAATGSGKRRINPHLLPLKKPDKVDILAARKLQLSGGVDAALSCILFFVSGSLQFQLPTKNEIGSPFRGSLSHFLVGAVLQQLLLLAEMVGFSRGLSNSNGLRLLIFPQPLGRALKNQNAAPTTPPCFCHRQRSSSLHRADCLRPAGRRPVLIRTIFAAKKAPA